MRLSSHFQVLTRAAWEHAKMNEDGRGFVAVRPDARDRRRRAIALTERGRAAADAVVKVAREITRHTLTPLTAAEQRR
ncbi:MAG TPA: hypothetical protein VH397_10360 [Xanthobacteraceae bacterium]|jgi:DNA-binding MarR family transcriptional regulator